MRLGGSRNGPRARFVRSKREVEGNARLRLVGGGVGPDLIIAFPGADRLDRGHEPRRSWPHASELVHHHAVGRLIGDRDVDLVPAFCSSLKEALMIGSAPLRADLTTNLMVEAATKRTNATTIPSWRGKNDAFMVVRAIGRLVSTLLR